MDLVAKRTQLVMLHANNKGTAKPAHLCSQFRTFIICFLESKIIKFSTCEKSDMLQKYIITKRKFIFLSSNQGGL